MFPYTMNGTGVSENFSKCQNQFFLFYSVKGCQEHVSGHLGLGLGLGLGICLCLTAFTMTSMVRDRGKCTGRRLSSIKPSELWFALLGFSSSSHNRESTLFGVQV